ncbi:hypothetical protein Tco_0943394 [Tanacetum coccineum]
MLRFWHVILTRGNVFEVGSQSEGFTVDERKRTSGCRRTTKQVAKNHRLKRHLKQKRVRSRPKKKKGNGDQSGVVADDDDEVVVVQSESNTCVDNVAVVIEQRVKVNHKARILELKRRNH